MFTYKEVPTMTQEVTDVYCDWCDNQIYLMDEFIRGGVISVEFGYGSEFDGNTFVAEICDKCWKKHFEHKMRLHDEDTEEESWE